MSSQSDFYLQRAESERELAAASNLANVREGHLRSAAAWDLLAARSVKGDRMRAEEEQRKAALKAALPPAEEAHAPPRIMVETLAEA